MKGHFSAYVNADVSQDTMAAASIKSGLLRLLRLGINENLYVLNDVRKVSFIGDRTTYVASPAPAPVQASGKDGVGAAALTFIILAALFVFLVGGFLVGRSVKKRKQEQFDKGMILDESVADEEVADASYNKGFMGGAVGENGAVMHGSLASTDELALQPQAIVRPVLSKSSSEPSVEESSASGVRSEETKASPKKRSPGKPSDGSAKPAKSAAAEELAAALLMASAAAASAEKAGEEVSGEKLNREAAGTKTSPPKKKKSKRKKGARAPDSPDSLLADSLRQLDSIAEEGEASIIDESAEDTGSRGLS